MWFMVEALGHEESDQPLEELETIGQASAWSAMFMWSTPNKNSGHPNAHMNFPSWITPSIASLTVAQES